MKITAGLYKNFRLIVPSGVRPTSSRLRQTVFNLCSHKLKGAHFLDVFAGSGAMGIEALSAGAQHVTFIDQSPYSIHAIKKALDQLHIKSQATLFLMDVLRALRLLEKKGKVFDLIYIDPPYGQTVRGGSQTYVDATLSLIEQSGLLAEGGAIFCETTSFIKCVLPSKLCLQSERRVGDSRLFEFRANGVFDQSRSSHLQAHSPV